MFGQIFSDFHIWAKSSLVKILEGSVPSRILTIQLLRICPKDKFIEIFAQRLHYFEDPFFKFFAFNFLFQDTSYSLALKYSSFLFKFFSFAFYKCNFWFKISKICPKISHFSQISYSRGNSGCHKHTAGENQQYLLPAVKLASFSCTPRSLFWHPQWGTAVLDSKAVLWHWHPAPV